MKIPVSLSTLCWRELDREFDAVTHVLASGGISFKARTIPVLQEHLVCEIDGVGQLNGRVTRVTPAGFFLQVLTRGSHVRQVMSRLIAAAREQKPKSHPWRDERVRAENIGLILTLQNGRRVPAALMNVSTSGAALNVEEPLQVGELVMVGSSGARVVRTFRGGVGVEFLRRLKFSNSDRNCVDTLSIGSSTDNIVLL